eukprot:2236114-Prymnesium_polylepis.1
MLVIAPAALLGAPSLCPEWCANWACDGSEWCRSGIKPEPCTGCVVASSPSPPARSPPGKAEPPPVCPEWCANAVPAPCVPCSKLQPSSADHYILVESPPSTSCPDWCNNAVPQPCRPCAGFDVHSSTGSSLGKDELRYSADVCRKLLADPTHLFRRMWGTQSRHQNHNGESGCWSTDRESAWAQPASAYFDEAFEGRHCQGTNWYEESHTGNTGRFTAAAAPALLGFDDDIQ